MTTDHTPEAESASLQDVLSTADFHRRPARPPDFHAESDALAALAAAMDADPQRLLQELVDRALVLCRAGSAGISMLEAGDQFRWNAIAGALSASVDGTIARDASPCGEVIVRDRPLLFTRPERHYGFPTTPELPIEEALLVPFRVQGRPMGTVWVIAHSRDRRFDPEDARLLTRLSGFASAAYRLSAALRTTEDARVQLAKQADERAAAADAARSLAESIVETVRDPLLVLDDGLRVVMASRAFYSAFQTAPADTDGQLVYQLGNGQWNIPALRTLLEELLPQHTTFRDFEVSHDFHSIGRRIMLLNARRLRRETGAPGLILLALEDVTDQRVAQAALHEAESRFTEMVKNVRDHAVFMTDTDGVVTTWNVAAESVFGYAETEAIGQNFSMIFTPEDIATSRPAFELHQARTEGRAEDERWHLRKNGDRFWAQGIVTPRRDEQGRLVGYSKILRDMSERQRAEVALRASEDRFRRAMAIGTVGVLFYRLDGRVLDANAAFERISGQTVDALRRLPDALALTPEGYHAATRHAMRELAERGETAPYEKQMLRQDGTRFWVLVAPTRLSDGGTQSECVEFILDVSDRRHAEAALRQSEERLRLALAAARMGTWHWELSGDRLERDANLNRLLGLESVETALPLADFVERVHPQDRERVRAAFDATVRDGSSLKADFRVVWPNGELHWLNDQGDLFGAGDGRYLAGACVDITDRKRLEDELRDADRRKDEFLAMLGHELRNPLAPLRNVLEALRRKQLTGEPLERAHAIMDRQVGHLARLVNDLLDVSRITLGLIELRRDPVNLAEAAEMAVEMATPALEARGHELTLALPRKPVQVLGDTARLTQVIFNLLNNAAKYTPSGGRIVLTLVREESVVAVHVRDNGSGMAADLVPRVFDLFTQGRQTLDRAQGGLGLGLTLVKRLVQLHGGTVEAASDGPGRGSEFTVRLPALAAEALPAPPAAAPSDSPAPVGMALVIDDVPDIANSYAWLFEGLMADVQVAYSGAQAIEMARSRTPDLVLCDLGMPGMDGYETCRRLRQLPGMATVLIAAVSGYGGEEYLRASREAGFDQCVVKPISRATLEGLVKAANATAPQASAPPR